MSTASKSPTPLSLYCNVKRKKSPNELWEEGKDIFLKVAKSSIVRKKKRNNQWISKETLTEVDDRRKLRAKGIKNDVGRAKYRFQNATVQRLIRKDKDKFINDQYQYIEENSGTNSLKDLFQGVRSLTSNFRPSIDTVKDENGTTLCENEEVKERWRQYCCNLYKKNGNILEQSPPNFVDSTMEPPPLLSEVEKAISELKNNKSPRLDEVAAELVKNGREQITTYFHKLCTAILTKKTWPDDWVKSIFVLIPIKGDLQQCSNNRTIALISHCSKILLKIIAGRIKVKMHEEINEAQTGFRPRTGTRNQILNLKMIIELKRTENMVRTSFYALLTIVKLLTWFRI